MSRSNDNDQIIMYGAMWCGDCRRAKKYFDSQGVAYKWVDLEQNPDDVKIVMKHNAGKQVIPTILFPDGTVLIEPSNAALARQLESSQL